MKAPDPLSRAMLAANVKKFNEFATILGLTPQDFSNRKKSGSLIPVILEWAANSGITADDRRRIEHRLITLFWAADEVSRSNVMLILEGSAKPEGNHKNGTEGC